MPVINGIHVSETQFPVQLVDFQAGPRLFLNHRHTDIIQIRAVIAHKIDQALEILPSDLGFMIFESYRPRSRQLMLWDKHKAQFQIENPGISEADLVILTEKFVSNPHKFGSGHQAAVAIDITLCGLDGTELDMGTAMHEFNAKTETAYPGLSPDIAANRYLLKNTLEQVGLINYPPEWWHYSYGDRLWAEVTKRDFAFFAPID